MSQRAADVVLSGHRHPITGLQHCADLLATSSQAGVHVWQMVCPTCRWLSFRASNFCM